MIQFSVYDCWIKKTAFFEFSTPYKTLLCVLYVSLKIPASFFYFMTCSWLNDYESQKYSCICILKIGRLLYFFIYPPKIKLEYILQDYLALMITKVPKCLEIIYSWIAFLTLMLTIWYQSQTEPNITMIIDRKLNFGEHAKTARCYLLESVKNW